MRIGAVYPYSAYLNPTRPSRVWSLLCRLANVTEQFQHFSLRGAPGNLVPKLRMPHCSALTREKHWYLMPNSNFEATSSIRDLAAHQYHPLPQTRSRHRVIQSYSKEILSGIHCGGESLMPWPTRRLQSTTAGPLRTKMRDSETVPNRILDMDQARQRGQSNLARKLPIPNQKFAPAEICAEPQPVSAVLPHGVQVVLGR
ncbi:uncharacterized protein CLUP02_18315 [Colletotrichum lupini]|uniref:Uncharacterized protein n=1 Tax=Colletotrichum lupini TaxID=145971 RepID=A0A9Q8SGJ6_9PEZI|nr:uncharacterized protein CLUP02_18315 [Colletotrichum lupini]UQC76800.1 hypothetical protein CLUP02_18315 [Colletotrichum lupini]